MGRRIRTTRLTRRSCRKQEAAEARTAPPIDVPDLDAKFDEVYKKGGIYHFMSHPQSLDFGPDGFYEKHLSHISRRPDVWYVPMGPVYAFHTIVERTDVKPLSKGGAKARFAVSNTLDPQDLQRQPHARVHRAAHPSRSCRTARSSRSGPKAVTDRWNEEYVRREGDALFVTVLSNTTLEFR